MTPKKEYEQIWYAYVDLEAEDGYEFNDLIDSEIYDDPLATYIGAWANILVQAKTIKEAVDIIEMSLREKNLKIRFFDGIENLLSLVEADDVAEDMIKDADRLYSSGSRFMITGELFAYTEK